MEYYFQDNLRWNLGWNTPNEAGAFLAPFIPICWLAVAVVQRLFERRLGAVRFFLVITLALSVFTIEAWLIWALSHTYSRGAWAGLGVGFVTGWGVLLVSRIGRPKGGGGSASLRPLSSAGRIKGAVLALRITLVASCLWFSSFGERLSPSYTVNDRSGLNRLDLWRGGLELVAASPISGWGWGQSGDAYVQWAQEIDRTERYKSMVNSYLTVAVELGLPVFAILFFLMLLPIYWAISLARKSKGLNLTLLIGLASAWGTWMGVIFFSNLWIFYTLWIFPSSCALIIFVLLIMDVKKARRSDVFSLDDRLSSRPRHDVFNKIIILGLALAVPGSMFSVGRSIASKRPFCLRRESSNEVTIYPRKKEKTVPIEVYPDAVVLGQAYGHEMRRWIVRDPSVGPLKVVIPDNSEIVLSANAVRVVFGDQLTRFTKIQDKLILIHPFGPPPEISIKLDVGSRVVLAGVDSTGDQYAWENWAKSQGVAPEVNAGMSLDVRMRWPDVVDGL